MMNEPKKPKHQPYKMVKMVLDLETQNATLHVLSDIFKINETWEQPHEIICQHSLFGEFILALLNSPEAKYISKLNATNVDLKKEPRRSVVKYRGMPYDPVHELSK